MKEQNAVSLVGRILLRASVHSSVHSQKSQFSTAVRDFDPLEIVKGGDLKEREFQLDWSGDLLCKASTTTL